MYHLNLNQYQPSTFRNAERRLSRSFQAMKLIITLEFSQNYWSVYILYEDETNNVYVILIDQRLREN